MKTAGIIVAGGEGSRLGGRAKPLLCLGGSVLIERLIRCIRPQVDSLALNLRRGSEDRYAPWTQQGVSVVFDPDGERIGPLGGVLAGLRWLATLDEEFDRLATFPGDAPFLAPDLVPTLLSAARGSGFSRPTVAFDGEHVQSLCALWPRNSLARLERGIADGRYRSVRHTLEDFGALRCPVEDAGSFFNINTWDDLAAAEQQVRGLAPRSRLS